MDAIGLKRSTGQWQGRRPGRFFLGLFTSSAYSQSPRSIPLLGEKVSRIVARAGFPPNSHDGKALLHILDTFSRNELFQASEDELYEMALWACFGCRTGSASRCSCARTSFERFVS